MVELPYGHHPYRFSLDGRDAVVVTPQARPRPAAIGPLLDGALASPIASPTLDRLVRDGDRVTVIVSDATRSEPRGAFFDALRRHLPSVRWTIAIATGTHGPSALETLELPRDAEIVNHDGHQSRDLVELGQTAHGTPVRLHRCLVESDLVIPTGCIRPHYFAGFGAGAKAVFPGLADAAAIRHNHALKIRTTARAGIVEGNPCREDLEEAAGMVPTRMFLLDGVVAPDDAVHAVVAGDVRLAFRAGAELARTWSTLRVPRRPVVIASDGLPVTATLYQAAKIAAAAAPVVESGGVLVVVAQCCDGIGPLPVVNEAIFRIGVLPRLAPGARLFLVSDLSASKVACTLLEYAPSVDAVLRDAAGPAVVIPHATGLILESSI